MPPIKELRELPVLSLQRFSFPNSYSRLWKNDAKAGLLTHRSSR